MLARGRLVFFVPLLLLVGLIVVLLRGLSLDPRLVDSPLIGKPAPAFVLPRLDDSGTLSQQDLQGGVSLLNVWASWCVSCRAEHEVLVELTRQYPELRVFGLNYKDQTDDARAWLARLGNPYVASAVDFHGEVGIDWGVYGVPETFVIDAQGRVVAKHVGPLTWDYVNRELLPLIKRLES